jgi:predicted CopG family antitoxin
MGHKTITISDDAYEALARARNDNESFTKVILRLTSEKTRASTLLEHLMSSHADEELARSVENVMQRSRRARLRRIDLSQRS